MIIKSLLILLLIPINAFAATTCENNTITREAIKCLDKKIELLNKNINSINRKEVEINVSYIPLEGFDKPNISDTIKSEGFKFELVKCYKKISTVSCKFIITNQDKKEDKNLHIYNKTIFYDEKGRQFNATSAELVEYTVIFKNDSYIKKKLISGVPVSANIIFEDIPLETKLITSLELVRYGAVINFRNISIVSK